ncbi:SH3 domain-containing protein [Vibrio sp. JC34]|uniref:SH3 domain-containing protein n=1 Tax=Vibrio sp. JC34 TaxID=3042470 RepID=UPI0034569B1E
MSKYSSNLELFSVFGKPSLMKHVEFMESFKNHAQLKQSDAFNSVVNATSLKPFSAFDSVVNAVSLNQLKAFDLAVNSASLNQLKALDSVVNAASLNQLKAFDSVINSASLNQLKALDLVVNAASLNQLKALDSVVNAASLKQIDAFNFVINAASLSNFDALNSLYTEQELSEFSEVLAEVGDNLQEEQISERDAERTLQKLPTFFLFFLKYLFNVIVMSLFVAVYVQPLVTEYLQNNNEPLRVQKNTIKKLPQSTGVEVTATNRFISGDGVRLRSSASVKAEIISHLVFGQLVYVLEKERSWVKVAVPQKDGSTLEGWVFNEYTERFR